MKVLTGTPDLFSGTSQSDLLTMGVDTDGDGTVDQDITGDVNGWQVTNGGTTLKIELSGAAYTADAEDSIITTVSGVDNPNNAGTYDLEGQTSGDGNWQNGTISITAT